MGCLTREYEAVWIQNEMSIWEELGDGMSNEYVQNTMYEILNQNQKYFKTKRK